MDFTITCSYCGHRSKGYSYNHPWLARVAPSELVKQGWRSYGCVLYCPNCVDTWEKRNGADKPLSDAATTKIAILETIITGLQDTVDYMKKTEDDLR